MNKRKLFKRGIAVLLAGLMVYSPSVTNVQAEDGVTTGTTTEKTIAGLGTDIIADPLVPASTSDAWAGSYVYFGTYDDSPVKYRVLDSDTSVFGGTTMLLDCDSILWAGSDPSSVFDADGSAWAGSDIRIYLNGTFLTSNFSASEQNVIASSTKYYADSTDGNGYNQFSYTSLDNDKIFFLDTKEVTNESYGYSNSYEDVANRAKKYADGNDAEWWLRSNNGRVSGYVAGSDSDGNIYNFSVTSNYVGVSPALNVNLSSVLFSSVISGTAGETGAEYKLTLIDSDMIIAGNGAVTRTGDTVTIPYTISGTNSSNATQVSVLLLDKEYTEGNTNDAEVLYYGALDTSVNNSSTGTFTLPSTLLNKVCGRDYYAYIIAEDVNGEKETDYASTPVEIADIYDEVSGVSVTVDAPVVGTTLDASVTTSTTDFSVTTVVWQDGNNTVTGNADYDTAYTVNVTLTAGRGYIFEDNVTATVNNHTATVIENNNGTITVCYTFEKTQMGTITHTTAGYEGIYDGQAHGITVKVTDPSDTIVTYSVDGTTYSEVNPTFTDAGVYKVYYKVTKDRYKAVTGEAAVTITKKALSVTADNQTITVGESIDNSKYTVSGLVSGDTLSSVTLIPSTTEITYNGTIEVSGAKIVNADGRDVTTNYDITCTAGKLVVNEAEEPKQNEPTPEEPAEYEITDGAGSEWTKNSDESITITGNGDFAKFVGVKVDGKFIDEANYTTKSGLTIVALKSSYLNTLSVGEHTFEIVWEDGLASTTFTVKQAEDIVTTDPDAGDNSLIGLWLLLLIGSGLTAVYFCKKKKYIVEE